MNYEKIANNVLKALTKNGRPVTLREYSVGGGDYDPATGGATPTSTGIHDTIRRALVADQPGSQISQRFGQNLDGNTLVQQAEKWLYMDAKGNKPGLQDRIIFDEIEYILIDVQECKPGLVPLFYLLVLRT